jgi:hypothetical protein
MPLPSLLIQEVEAPLAVTLSISEDISVVSTPSLKVAPIQNLRVGSGAFAHTLLTPEEADPSGGGKTRICSHFDYTYSNWKKPC